MSIAFYIYIERYIWLRIECVPSMLKARFDSQLYEGEEEQIKIEKKEGAKIKRYFLEGETKKYEK